MATETMEPRRRTLIEAEGLLNVVGSLTDKHVVFRALELCGTRGEGPAPGGYVTQVVQVAESLEEAGRILAKALDRAEGLRRIREAGGCYGGLRTGRGMDEMSYGWAVLAREAGESDEDAIARAEAFASEIGWTYYYGGPGRMFAEAPWITVSRTRILVVHPRGYDV